ncbi:AMP-binding protein [Penaeicola halotolerans]|uniref:AMP-binding protein n=1 Tax=Penaeicola halotolerans TaxID=2793196 RepID=UPI001CF8ABF5|nr:AMP-binding protein [Penaeicola halotolerans]
MKQTQLHLNQRTYTFKDILEQKYLQPGLNDFELHALGFAHDWLSGKQVFNLQTSGSTGSPKHFEASRTQMALSAQLTGQALGFDPSWKVLNCLNTAYIAGKMMMVRAFEWDMELHIIEPGINPFDLIADDHQYDFTALVPMQLQAIIQKPRTLAKLEDMKAVLIGGAPLDQDTEDKLQSINTPIYLTYGMTETVSHIALRRLNGPKASSAFEVFDEIKIGTDDRGCLTISSALTDHELLVTNDLVELLDSRRFHWLGRADFVINSGGVKIQPEQVEKEISKVLTSLQIKNRYFIWAKDDPQFGQKVVLILERDPLDANLEGKLLSLAKEKLPPYHAPKEILYRPSFVMTATGKIQRKQSFEL